MASVEEITGPIGMRATMGDRIRVKRKEHHLTQEELGKLIGVAKPTINRYEKNVIKDIPTKQIYKLAEVLEVSPEYLIGWDINHPEDANPDDFRDPFIVDLTQRWDRLDPIRKGEFKKLVAYMYPELVHNGKDYE